MASPTGNSVVQMDILDSRAVLLNERNEVVFILETMTDIEREPHLRQEVNQVIIVSQVTDWLSDGSM